MIADVGDIGVELPVLRSVLVKFGEALVNPPPAIMAPPDGAADHPAVNGPPRNNDPPDAPNASPRRSRAGIEIILGVAQRARSHNSNPMVGAEGSDRSEYVRAVAPSDRPPTSNFRQVDPRSVERSRNVSRLLSLIGVIEVKSGTENSEGSTSHASLGAPPGVGRLRAQGKKDHGNQDRQPDKR